MTFFDEILRETPDNNPASNGTAKVATFFERTNFFEENFEKDSSLRSE